jgi:hypothetical protein
MNRIFYAFLIGLFFASTLSYGQSQRLILFEEATNASCGPCASQNPGFDALLGANEDKCCAIKYHSSWPGYDPMYNHNTTENSGRISYYGINGVPTAVMDGTQQGAPAGFTQGTINARYAVPSPFSMQMNYEISPDQTMIYVTLMIEATQDQAGDLRAHIAVVENEINFASPPGGNGEKDFHDVMKKMIPDDDGTNIDDFEDGDYIILTGSWEMANIYDMDEVRTIGFVQDNSNRTVHQACVGTTDQLTPLYNNDLNPTAIMNVSETNCNGVTAPQVMLRNNGAGEVTSTTFYYHVNGEELHSFTWNGSLNFLESELVQLPEIEFTIEDMNEVVIYSDMPNGSADEYVKNDTIKLEFARAVIAPQVVNLMVRTDDNPEEITWEILNSSGEQVASGGPYSDPQTIEQEEITLPYYDCFKFFIYDAGGDGLQMPGFYAFFYGGSNYIASGTTFGAVDSAYFEGNTAVGIPEPNSNMDLTVYPNPATTDVNISFFLETRENVNVQMFNSTGMLISTEDLGSVDAGPQEIRIERPDVPSGIYFIKVNVGNQQFTQRVSFIN